MTQKSFATLAVEATVVGICLVILVTILKYSKAEHYLGNEYALLFVAGVVFHLLFQISGLNLWYSLNYCKWVQTQN